MSKHLVDGRWRKLVTELNRLRISSHQAGAPVFSAEQMAYLMCDYTRSHRLIAYHLDPCCAADAARASQRRGYPEDRKMVIVYAVSLDGEGRCQYEVEVGAGFGRSFCKIGIHSKEYALETARHILAELIPADEFESYGQNLFQLPKSSESYPLYLGAVCPIAAYELVLYDPKLVGVGRGREEKKSNR